MKSIKIKCPEGHEIDKDKSTFEEIVFKKIETKLPLSVKEIPNRFWFINSYGSITTSDLYEIDKNNLSSAKRAKAFLALMQLVELKDAWNGDWKPDWTNSIPKFVISTGNNDIKAGETLWSQKVLNFKTKEIRDKFFITFIDLIKEAEELI